MLEQRILTEFAVEEGVQPILTPQWDIPLQWDGNCGAGVMTCGAPRCFHLHPLWRLPHLETSVWASTWAQPRTKGREVSKIIINDQQWSIFRSHPTYQKLNKKQLISCLTFAWIETFLWFPVPGCVQVNNDKVQQGSLDQQGHHNEAYWAWMDHWNHKLGTGAQESRDLWTTASVRSHLIIIFLDNRVTTRRSRTTKRNKKKITTKRHKKSTYLCKTTTRRHNLTTKMQKNNNKTLNDWKTQKRQWFYAKQQLRDIKRQQMTSESLSCLWESQSSGSPLKRY